MTDDPNRKNRLQYLWPWVGMAAIVGLMWAFAGE